MGLIIFWLKKWVFIVCLSKKGKVLPDQCSVQKSKHVCNMSDRNM